VIYASGILLNRESDMSRRKINIGSSKPHPFRRIAATRDAI